MAGRPQLSARSGPTYKLATFMNDNWDKMVSRTNEDVAMDLGYKSANMISMWRTGKTRISLEKLPDIARLMKLDMATLLPLWFEQYWGERADGDALIRQFSERIVTSNELTTIKAIRKANKNKDLLLDADTLNAVVKVISSKEAAKAALES